MKRTTLTVLLLFCCSLSFGQMPKWFGKDLRLPNYTHHILVEYELGKGKLLKDSANRIILDSVVRFMKENPGLIIQVENNSDSRASTTSSSNISQYRAQRIVDTLIKLGIAPPRLVAKGWGPTRPLIKQSIIDAMKTQEEKEAAYAVNRRTEIRILSTNYGHETFNWNDTVFYVGSKRKINVEWDLDYSGLRRTSLDTIKPVIEFMKKNPTIKIEVANHTDPQGSESHDQRLSEMRSLCIATYIISEGIDSLRVTPKGYGFSRPLPGCSKEEIDAMKTKQEKDSAYQKDRRTEIVIIAK